MKAARGLDFGTESVRAVLMDLHGRELATSSANSKHGQITEPLPGSKRKLPPHYALQYPLDWIESAVKTTRAALRAANGPDVIGGGGDFTSCTMLPTQRDGTPLCLLEQFAAEPLAWPKLWKHHGAQAQTDRINAVARERGESFPVLLLSSFMGASSADYSKRSSLHSAGVSMASSGTSLVLLAAGLLQ